MNTKALPKINVFLYVYHQFPFTSHCSLKFDLFKIGAILDRLSLHGFCRLLPPEVRLPKPV
jgi:hypothetical protein